MGDANHTGSNRRQYNPNPPPRYYGLDWDAIAKKRAARLDDEIARGVDNAETRRHLMSREEEAQQTQKIFEKKSPRKSNRDASRKGGQKKGPRWDVDKGVEMYELGTAPKDIAIELGLSYDTVIKGLKYRGIKLDRNRHRHKLDPATGGKPRNKFCGKCGADLDKPGNSRERVKKRPDGTEVGNGRECVPCTRTRNNRPGRWETDPRNPKNGGSGTWSAYKAEQQRQRREELRKEIG